MLLWCVAQHVFAFEGRDELIKAVSDIAASNIGVSIKQRKEPITFDQYQLHRLGKYRQDICVLVRLYVVLKIYMVSQ